MNQEKKPHVSATQLDMFCRCGEQYRRRYIEKEVIPPGVALLVGRGVHVAAETNFTQKIESHVDLPVGQIVDAAVAGTEAEAAGGFMLPPGDDRKPANAMSEVTDQVAQLATIHATKQAPEYQPTEVEVGTRIELPSATHDLLGYTDLRDDKDRVTDFKTAARKPSDDTADRSLQLTIYAAAFQVDHGRPAAGLQLDVLTKTKTPGRYVLPTQRGQEHFQRLANRINVMLTCLAAGNYPPCDPGAWVCGPKWCGYYATCPYRH